MSWPEVTVDHQAAAQRVLDRGVFVDGPETRSLEEEAAAELGYQHATFVSNGTTALMASMSVCGVGPSSVVAVPALTFSGTAFAATALGARIEFVDVGYSYVVEGCWPDFANLHVPVHLHGKPCVARVPGSRYVVDDACQAPRARTPGAVAGCVSLNASKTLWAGEGGLVLTDDEGFDTEVKARRRFGEMDWGSENPRPYLSVLNPAGNWRGTEMAAALGRASLLHLGRWEEQSCRSAEVLSWAIEQAPLLEGPDLTDYLGVHKYRVLAPAMEDVPQLMKALRAGPGVPVARWGELALPDMIAFREYARACPVARDVVERSIIIGDETQPLAITTEEEAAQWASHITEVAR